MEIRLISEGRHSAAYNMAADEALYMLHSGGVVPPTLRLWEFSESSVMLGRFSCIYETVHTGEIEKLGMHPVRRFTGGGVTYNDSSGDLGWTFVSSGSNTVGKYVQAFNAVRMALSLFGIEAEMRGISDITVGGLKISGLAGARSGNTVLVHGTMLYNPDLSMMNRVLKPFHENNGSVVPPASRVTSLRTLTGMSLSPEDVKVALVEGFSHIGDVVEGKKSRLESDLAVRLMPRYEEKEWNFRL